MSAKESLEQLNTIFICLKDMQKMPEDIRLQKYGTEGVNVLLEIGMVHLKQIESELIK